MVVEGFMEGSTLIRKYGLFFFKKKKIQEIFLKMVKDTLNY